MTQHKTHPAAPAGAGASATPPLSAANHVGLGLAALLALVDLASVFAISEDTTSAEAGPPAEVLWFAFAMGLVTLMMVALAWAGRWRRPAVRLAAVARVLSAVTALPGFLVEGVPPVFVLWAAATVLLTLVAVLLMMLRPRRAPAPGVTTA